MMALAAAAAWLFGFTPQAFAGQPEPAHATVPAAQAAAPSDAGHEAAPQGGEHATPQAGAHQGEGEHGEGEHAAESPWALIGKLFNFAVLAGGLVYLLRSPFAVHLRTRAVQIRSELAKAADMREGASAQLTQIEARIKGLPAEIEALKQRGASEIVAEEARIREATEAERQRMLDQARREVETQVRTAERMLLKRAGELAVDVATERVRRTITAGDQARLMERYLAQVRG